MIKYLAPAKINLVLEVLGERSDGYHEIRSLVQTVSLCDSLEFELADAISLKCNEPSLQSSDNLVIRAAELLRNLRGCQKGARIKLEKRIPWGVGLGGGSSDASATLMALNKLWTLNMTNADLVGIAARLGSDVPLFLHRGTTMVEGRGEKVTPLDAISTLWFVLVVPPMAKISDKTRQLYARLSTQHFTDGHLVDEAVKYLDKTKRIDPGLLFNVFDKVAFDAFPGLDAYWKSFEEAGAKGVHLTGSGPGMFALVGSEIDAKKLRSQLRKCNLQAYSISNS